MPMDEVVSRVKYTENFTFEYIGNTLRLDMIAVRSTSGDADKFKAVVKKVAGNNQAATHPLHPKPRNC